MDESIFHLCCDDSDFLGEEQSKAQQPHADPLARIQDIAGWT